MPIIKPTRKVQNETVRVPCPLTLLEEIQQYCAAFHIEKPELFFVQAAQYILQHDKDWTRSKKIPRNASDI